MSFEVFSNPSQCVILILWWVQRMLCSVHVTAFCPITPLAMLWPLSVNRGSRSWRGAPTAQPPPSAAALTPQLDPVCSHCCSQALHLLVLFVSCTGEKAALGGNWKADITLSRKSQKAAAMRTISTLNLSCLLSFGTLHFQDITLCSGSCSELCTLPIRSSIKINSWPLLSRRCS